MASGRRDAEELFPEHFAPVEDGTGEVFEDPEAKIDFSEVVYTPMTEEAYAEYEALLFGAQADEDDGPLEVNGSQQEREWI